MKKELALSFAIAIATAGVSFGICQNQIQNNKENISKIEITHEKDFNTLQEKQNSQDALLQSINNNLASLNTKMDLLVAGKLRQGEIK